MQSLAMLTEVFYDFPQFLQKNTILLFLMTFPFLNKVQRNSLEWFLKVHFVTSFKVACCVQMHGLSQ
jgi:hypothetical protein